MYLSDQFIERVLSGNATEEEKRLVTQYLRDNPDKLAQYLTAGSWEAFEPDDTLVTPGPAMRAFLESRIGAIPEEEQGASVQRMAGFADQQERHADLQIVHIDEGAPWPEQDLQTRKIRFSWIAAASVVLLAGIAVYFGARPKPNGDQDNLIGIKSSAADLQKRPDSLQRISNESEKAKICFLPDDSKVRLAAHSSVSFINPFPADRRDVYLKGQATFTVARDTKKAFTVHSKGFATTALGTVFSVDDRQGIFAIIHLYSGKVVVKQEKKGTAPSLKDVYLSPGQQLVVNTKENIGMVSMTDSVHKGGGQSAKPLQRAILQFNKRPLSDIFVLLRKEYGITVRFDPEMVKNMDFTGSFDGNKETVESFLQTLCDLNELTLIKTSDNGFSIQVK